MPDSRICCKHGGESLVLFSSQVDRQTSYQRPRHSHVSPRCIPPIAIINSITFPLKVVIICYFTIVILFLRCYILSLALWFVETFLPYNLAITFFFVQPQQKMITITWRCLIFHCLWNAYAECRGERVKQRPVTTKFILRIIQSPPQYYLCSFQTTFRSHF